MANTAVTVRSIEHKSDGKNGTRSSGNCFEKENEIFKKELDKLEGHLNELTTDILASVPKYQDHIPYVFNDLEPYRNTSTAEYLICLAPKNTQTGYASRCTAATLVDPWEAYKMDVTILPRIERKDEIKMKSKTGHRYQNKEASEGSTYLPKFPIVELNANLLQRSVLFSDVPLIRKELNENYTANAMKKIEQDFLRTKQDFHRMELDRLNEFNERLRKIVRQSYFAYLQNTPGSRKAVTACVHKLDKLIEKENEAKLKKQRDAEKENQQKKEKVKHKLLEEKKLKREKQEENKTKHKQTISDTNNLKKAENLEEQSEHIIDESHKTNKKSLVDNENMTNGDKNDNTDDINSEK